MNQRCAWCFQYWPEADAVVQGYTWAGEHDIVSMFFQAPTTCGSDIAEVSVKLDLKI